VQRICHSLPTTVIRWQSRVGVRPAELGIEKRSREATDGIDLAAVRMLHLATASLSMARAARPIYRDLHHRISRRTAATTLSGLSHSG